MKCNTGRCCAGWAGASLLLTILGILSATVLYQYVSQLLVDGLRQRYVLDNPNAGVFDEWRDSATPNGPLIMTDFTVYHINNPWGVTQGEKPNLTEIGPLHYVYNQKKLNITWPEADNGDTIEYNHWQYYTPYDAATRELQERNVTSINMPYLAIMNNSLGPLALYTMGGFSADPMSLFVNRSMRDVIFGWKNDSLLQGIHGAMPAAPVDYPGIQENDTDATTALALHSRDRIYTGKTTTDRAREFQMWDGMTETMCCPYGACGDAGSGSPAVRPWHTDDAERMSGSFGDQFHQYLNTSSEIRISTHGFGIFRWWPFSYNQSYSVKGIDVYKFTMLPGTLGNDTVNPGEAKAYDIHGPSGILNLTECELGTQLYLGRPRYLYASDSLGDAVVGMGAPDPALHDTYVGVEPLTGQTLDFHFRVSANVYIEPKQEDLPIFGKVWFFQNVTPVYLPLLWADRFGTASDAQIDVFNSKVTKARTIMKAALWGGSAVAASFGALGLGFAFQAWRKSAKRGTADVEGFVQGEGGEYAPIEQ